MSKEEAKAVIEIMMTTDGECPVCAGRLIGLFVDNFPEHEPTANEVWGTEYQPETGWKKY